MYGVFYMLLVNSNYCTTKTYTHGKSCLFVFCSSLLCLCYSDKGCQMKGFEVCNLTIQTALDQFPSLYGCVCACQEDLCASTRALASQCHRQAGAVLSSFWDKHLLLRLHFCLPKKNPRAVLLSTLDNVHLLFFCSSQTEAEHTAALEVEQLNRLWCV